MAGFWSSLMRGRTGGLPAMNGGNSIRARFASLPGTKESRRVALIGVLANALAIAHLLDGSPSCLLHLVMPLG